MKLPQTLSWSCLMATMRVPRTPQLILQIQYGCLTCSWAWSIVFKWVPDQIWAKGTTFFGHDEYLFSSPCVRHFRINQNRTKCLTFNGLELQIYGHDEKYLPGIFLCGVEGLHMNRAENTHHVAANYWFLHSFGMSYNLHESLFHVKSALPLVT